MCEAIREETNFGYISYSKREVAESYHESLCYTRDTPRLVTYPITSSRPAMIWSFQ